MGSLVLEELVSADIGSEDCSLSIRCPVESLNQNVSPAEPEVTQDAIHKNDPFAFWNVAGRTNTPLTEWKLTRRFRSPGETARERQELEAMLSTKPSHGTKTIRAVLAGCRPSTCPGSLKSPRKGDFDRLLDGEWFSKVDCEHRATIQGNRLIWLEDGSSSKMLIRGDRGQLVSMSVDGQKYSGVLSEDGALIRWCDGDVWVRHHEEFRKFQEVLGSTMDAFASATKSGDNDQVRWSTWKQRYRSGSEGSAFPRPSSPKSKQDAMPRYEHCGTGGAILPPLKGILLVRR